MPLVLIYFKNPFCIFEFVDVDKLLIGFIGFIEVNFFTTIYTEYVGSSDDNRSGKIIDMLKKGSGDAEINYDFYNITPL